MCALPLQVFAELEDRLKVSFGDYLQERGVTAEMADYLVELLDDKEQREYMLWLKDVQKFINR